MFAVALLKWRKVESNGKNIFLSIDWSDEENTPPENYLANLSTLISKHVTTSDLRRFDIRSGSSDATYFLDISGIDSLSALTEELQKTYPEVGVTFLDQNQMPSI